MSSPPDWIQSGADGPSSGQTTGHEVSNDMDLAEGATSILLRSLPPEVTLDRLLEKLDTIAKGKYDFVYLPYSSRTNVNIAFSFINLVDHDTAKHVYHVLRQEAMDSKPHAGGRQVCQGRVQGLAANLAYYVATTGLSELDNPHAPRVFKNGARCDLSEAINEHVTCRHLLEARQDMESRGVEQRDKHGSSSSHGGDSKCSGRGRSSTSTYSGKGIGATRRQGAQRFNEGYAPQQNPKAPQMRPQDLGPIRTHSGKGIGATRRQGAQRFDEGYVPQQHPKARQRRPHYSALDETQRSMESADTSQGAYRPQTEVRELRL